MKKISEFLAESGAPISESSALDKKFKLSLTNTILQITRREADEEGDEDLEDYDSEYVVKYDGAVIAKFVYGKASKEIMEVSLINKDGVAKFLGDLADNLIDKGTGSIRIS
jgi:hypothetical protein